MYWHSVYCLSLSHGITHTLFFFLSDDEDLWFFFVAYQGQINFEARKRLTANQNTYECDNWILKYSMEGLFTSLWQEVVIIFQHFPEYNSSNPLRWQLFLGLLGCLCCFCLLTFTVWVQSYPKSSSVLQTTEDFQ